MQGNGVFSRFELGEISPEEFRDAIRKEADESLTDRKIDDMRNLMLLNIPREKLDLLLELRERYMVYLLSSPGSSVPFRSFGNSDRKTDSYPLYPRYCKDQSFLSQGFLPDLSEYLSLFLP